MMAHIVMIVFGTDTWWGMAYSEYGTKIFLASDKKDKVHVKKHLCSNLEQI